MSSFKKKRTKAPHITHQIIEAVKKHPVLYSSTIKNNNIKLQDFKQNVWKKIALELGLNVVTVKLKWKSLRDTYSRILKGKTKIDKNGRKEWTYKKHLKFLKFPFEIDYEPVEIELTDDYIQEIQSFETNKNKSYSELFEEQSDEEIDFDEFLEIVDVSEIRKHKNPHENEQDVVNIHKNRPIIDAGMSHTNDDLVNTKTINIRRHIESENEIHVHCLEESLQTKNYQLKNSNKILVKTKHSPEDISQMTVSTLQNWKAVPKQNNTPIIKNPHNSLNIKSVMINKQRFIKTSADADISKFSSQKEWLPAPKTDPNKNNCSIDGYDYRGAVERFFGEITEIVKKMPPLTMEHVKTEVLKIVQEAEKSHGPQEHKHENMPGSLPRMVLVPCVMLNKDAGWTKSDLK